MDLLKLLGSLTTQTPVGDDASLDPQLVTSIDERLALKSKAVYSLELTADGYVSIPFGIATNVHVVAIKADGVVTARVTSAAGSQQLVPVDGVAVLICKTVPYTALDLARAAGVNTVVKVFVGEKL